jgi:hypothetical protein
MREAELQVEVADRPNGYSAGLNTIPERRDRRRIPLEPGEIRPQVAVETEQGGQRAALGGGGYVLANGEIGEEGVDLCLPHVQGMLLAVVQDAPAHPDDVRAFSCGAVVTNAQRKAKLLQQAGLARRWLRRLADSAGGGRVWARRAAVRPATSTAEL